MKAVQSGAALTTDMGKKTASFWLMENLSSTFLKTAQPGESLRDPDLPIETLPISHCGMGIGAVELAGFQPGKLIEVIELFSHPDYRLFAYEGSGAMLALYEPDMFHLVARTFARMGLLPLPSMTRPLKDKFVQSFDPEIQRLIAHGYGRMLYFKNHSIAGAIHEAQRAGLPEVQASFQGVAFAYSMVNNRDLARVFRAGQDLAATPAGAGFRNGLTYALEFWEWMSPGFLRWLEPDTEFGSQLIQKASEEITRCRAQGGPLLPFRLSP
jgi:hypothetical protein